MAKSISVAPKKRGRPATGRAPIVPVRFPLPIIKAVDEVAKDRDITRSDVIREAVEQAVRHRLNVAKGKAR